MNAPALKLFYDGRCPFCVAQMRQLTQWNAAGRLAFVDIAEPGFDPLPLGVDLAALNLELHGLDANGKLVVGTDAIVMAYALVGRGWLVLPLRLKALRPLFAMLYRSFARTRYRISRLLGYGTAPVCTEGVCSTRHPFSKH